jgi:hypothetical protein
MLEGEVPTFLLQFQLSSFIHFFYFFAINGALGHVRLLGVSFVLVRK